ncbi:MAG: HAMP domain-containing histidine kinase [Thaumarchaeota archaeon]|nr:HAMP domain-containing histidine kinase [Nitrososphaerota archaeon]
MFLKYKLPLTFSILSLLIIVVTAAFYMEHITEVMIHADREKMKEKLATKKLEIVSFHYDASEKLEIVFQDLLKTDHGRFIVVDPQGFVIADSNYSFPTENISEEISEEESMSEEETSEEETTVADKETTEEEHSDLHEIKFPSSDRFLDFIEEFKTQESGTISYEDDREIYYAVYTKLPIFEWILIFEESRSLIVSENKESVERLGVTIATFSTLVSIGVVFATFYISKRFTKPLSKLINAANEISKGKFNSEIKVVGKDEISELTSTFNKMTESLKESEKQKDEFSSMVSHELKTPLTPLMAYSEMLKNKILGPLNKDQQTAANAINSASTRLDNLISELLDAKKLALGKLEIHKKEFQPSELINKLVLDIDPLVKSKGISVITSSATARLFSDPDRIYQVLTNLVTNAIKAVPEKTGKIEIAFKDEEKSSLFYIKDNGVGIPKEKQSKLFTKFYQVDTSLTRKFGGTGLGLTICKGIVEKLGGKIWVESDRGIGATFYFTIPKEQVTIENISD